MLFDDFERTDDGPSPFSEGTYAFLNRVAGCSATRIRALLEAWLSDYPAEHRPELRNRLTNADQGQFLGAWWELYIHSLYRSLGFSVEIHPELDGVARRPDFLVTRDRQSMFIECTVDSATDGPITATPGIEAAIYDAINDVTSSDFMIGVEFKREGKSQPDRNEIKRDIGNWLGGLDADAVINSLNVSSEIGQVGTLPRREFPFRDWIVVCTAYPMPRDRRISGRRWIGSLPPSSAFVVRNTERIRAAVQDKGSRYGPRGSLAHPFVVALLSANSFAEEDDVTQALFGSLAVEFGRDSDEPATWTRRRDGYWRGPNSDRGARVAGVLFSHDLHPWSVGSHLPALWINPWADKQLEPNPMFTVFTADDGGRVTSCLSEKTPVDVFGESLIDSPDAGQ